MSDEKIAAIEKRVTGVEATISVLIEEMRESSREVKESAKANQEVAKTNIELSGEIRHLAKTVTRALAELDTAKSDIVDLRIEVNEIKTKTGWQSSVGKALITTAVGGFVTAAVWVIVQMKGG